MELSGVPVSILHELVGVLLRIIYDALFWSRYVSEGGRERPLLVVLEEAHTYLGRGELSPAPLAVRRIVNEGRANGFAALFVILRHTEMTPTTLVSVGTTLGIPL